MKPPQRIKQVTIDKPSTDFSYIAKTNLSINGTKLEGINVFTHCTIVGLVARELIDRLPDWLKTALFPRGCELVSAVHDVGKISPGFQEKIYRALGVVLGLVSKELDRNIGGHGAVSQAAVSEAGRFIPEIVGRHHGATSLQTGMPNDDNYGGKPWQDERLKTIGRLKNYFQADWPEVTSDIHADVLSGLTTVADWIGSGPTFSFKEEINVWDTPFLTRQIQKALDVAGFVRPAINKGLMFEEIFPPFSPHPIQKLVIEIIKSPGVYVMEAPMGVGKTEAALFAAYKALEADRATGIYFALPTQLTSNKMVDRMNRFLEKILQEDAINRKSLLLHGAAWLRSTEIGEEGKPGKSWFDYRKRGLLAPFAVGTIDQALMAVMNVKHGFVRTFGLSGKVVILDEVHSYDSYTGTLIDQLVKALREIHCTVIILSATLTLKRRAALFCDLQNEPDSCATAYPIVSSFPREGKFEIFPSESIENANVCVSMCGDDDRAIMEAIIRAERGEQVLWLENTVDEAQRRFKVLGAKTAELNLDCGLLHSRFLKTDREKNESKWVSIFGKEGRNLRGMKGCILVGTQVLEQSLDIDGDFLISRICPTDMILQRLGRLWRHRVNDSLRPKEARREAWILSPTFEESIEDEKKFGKTAMVYAPYVLYRSVEVWQNLIENNGGKIYLPEQMRELIEATYTERSEKGSLACYKHQIEEIREKLSRLARVGISRGGTTLPESKASTRYSETENVDVLLIRNKRKVDNGFHLRMLDNSLLVLPKKIRFRGRKEWRKIAIVLQQNTVSVPDKLAPVFSLNEMGFLKDFAYLGNDDEHPFRAAIVRESGQINGIGQQVALPNYRLRYDSTLGYLAEKQETQTVF